MARPNPLTSRQERRRRAQLSTADIVFFVLAGVSPMGAVVSLLAISIASGAGPGVPGVYVVAAVILALFAVGYVQISRRITLAGAFYAYAKAGLGDRVGNATAYLGLLAYNAATIGIFGSFAYFASQVVNEGFGAHTTWQFWAVVGFTLVAVLSYFRITASAVVLGVALLAESAALLAFSAGVLAHNGFHGFSLAVFSPGDVFGSGFGISLMFAFGSFVGFEATALYAAEARDARRSVPRATAMAIAMTGVFYIVVSWAGISAAGTSDVRAVAGKDPSDYFFDQAAHYLGGAARDVMYLLVVTSLFAAFLAFHFNTARYTQGVAIDGLLPRFLRRRNRRYGAPVAASAAQLALVAVVTTLFALLGQSPYYGLGVSMFSLGVAGIVLVQAIASAAVVAYFVRHRTHESKAAAIWAPALGAAGLVAGFVIMIQEYKTLTGSEVPWINHLPVALAATAALGLATTSRATRVARPRHLAPPASWQGASAALHR